MLNPFKTAVALLALVSGSVQAQPQQDRIVVVTALPVTYSITATLAEGTSIVVRNFPQRPRPLSALSNFFETSAERLREEFREADAVVTVGKLWPRDPLFTAVRSENIRVVEIDATKPWSATLEGISVALEPEQTVEWAETEPGDREPSVYYWLSPSNGARSAEIIAADLMRLAPDYEARIKTNLDGFRQELLELKQEYEVKFARLPSLAAFALAPEFVYLTTDMGIFVDGAFFKQDIAWTDGDLTALRNYLEDRVPVAIHKWEPAARIRQAIDAAGAELVVLDIGDLGIVDQGELRPDSYLVTMRANLEAIFRAFSRTN